MLYQLSYSRAAGGVQSREGECRAQLSLSSPLNTQSHWSELNRRPLDYESSALPLSYSGSGTYGADRDRTGDLCSAIAALSQLSYSPFFCGFGAYGRDRTRTCDLYDVNVAL